MKTTEPASPLPTAVYIARRHVNGVEMRLWAFLRGLSIWPLSEKVHSPLHLVATVKYAIQQPGYYHAFQG